MTRYAASTSVAVSTSKAEIERIVERYGAIQFMSGWSAEQALIAFTMECRQVRFILPMPSRDEKRFTHHSKGPRARLIPRRLAPPDILLAAVDVQQVQKPGELRHGKR